MVEIIKYKNKRMIEINCKHGTTFSVSDWLLDFAFQIVHQNMKRQNTNYWIVTKTNKSSKKKLSDKSD